MPDQFLNQKQLARRWGLSPRTIERWRWQARGPRYLKIVGRILYQIEDIEAFEKLQLRLGSTVSTTNDAGRSTAIAPTAGACSLISTHRHAA